MGSYNVYHRAEQYIDSLLQVRKTGIVAFCVVAQVRLTNEKYMTSRFEHYPEIRKGSQIISFVKLSGLLIGRVNPQMSTL